MEEQNLDNRKMSKAKLKLLDLNPHLMCVLCGGYYIDATTIVECLHSFCRSCIVKHLESSKYCPICEVQVHKTKPLLNIRPDKTLQDIVYKLVPGLFANEMRNRRKFYKERPHYIKPNNSELIGEVSGEFYINDENITFSLVYHTGSISTNVEDCYKEIAPPVQTEKRYFKCPTGVTVYHLKKLLKTKYELNDTNYKMEVYLKDQVLHEDLTLLDISYIYLWKSKGNLDLTYKIFENVVKRQKIEENVENASLSVLIKEPEKCLLQNYSIQPKKEEVENFKEQVNDKELKEEENKMEVEEKFDQSEDKVLTPIVDEPVIPSVEPIAEVVQLKEKEESNHCAIKENGVIESESKEVQLQISESGVMSVSQVEDGKIVRTMEDTPPKVVKNQLITGLSLGLNKGNEDGVKTETVSRLIPQEPQRKPPSKPVKSYKTIRCAPKTWHPVIPKEKLRPTLIKNPEEPKKPLKFFKMRNMPRFLGNPSSGVKPMYAEPQESNTEEKKKPQEKKPEAIKNKILKIDPKTLRPIEKEEVKVTIPTVPNLLTNPFIPNNNHFLFSDLHLLPPNCGNFSSKFDSKSGDKVPSVGVFKTPVHNGSYPPICFPSPDHKPNFYPFSTLTKPQNFPFPLNDKMDPLLRASRLSPFGNLTGFNVAGFHASLPPSISRLLNPHHHFRKINQSLDKKNKDESTKETNTTINCDDSLKVSNANDGRNESKEVKVGDKGRDKEEKDKLENDLVKEEVKSKEEEEKKERQKDAETKSSEGVKIKGDKGGDNNESASIPEVKSNTNSENVTAINRDKDKER